MRSNTGEQRGNKGVVLLVEDDPAVRAQLRSILESGEYTVLESADPAEALRLFGQFPPSPIDLIDLLLTKMVMPQMSGITLAERLLPLHRGMKVMYLSGYSDELLQQQGVRSSSAFLPNPFTPAELLNKIREVLRSPTVQPRRQHHRADCRGTEAECEWSKRHIKAQGVNLSEGGILLENIGEPIPLAERIVLELKIASGGRLPGLGGRVVRRVAPDAIAVRFENLSITERAALRQMMVSKERSDPASIPYA